MSASLDLFRTLIPAYASVPDATVEAFITQAATRFTASAWGAVYVEAVVYVAAHLIATTPGLGVAVGAAPGQVTGRSVDGVSQSYAAARVADEADEDWASTVYGRRYLQLRRSRPSRLPSFVPAGGGA